MHLCIWLKRILISWLSRSMCICGSLEELDERTPSAAMWAYFALSAVWNSYPVLHGDMAMISWGIIILLFGEGVLIKVVRSLIRLTRLRSPGGDQDCKLVWLPMEKRSLLVSFQKKKIKINLYKNVAHLRLISFEMERVINSSRPVQSSPHLRSSLNFHNQFIVFTDL